MEAWFGAEASRWLSLLSLMSLLSLLSVYARQGRFRTVVMMAFWSGFALGAAFLLGAVLAWLLAQPFHVVFALGLTGGIVTPIMAWAVFDIWRQYRHAEIRRSIAQDL